MTPSNFRFGKVDTLFPQISQIFCADFADFKANLLKEAKNP
jgi:hypothetical protein